MSEGLSKDQLSTESGSCFDGGFWKDYFPKNMAWLFEIEGSDPKRSISFFSPSKHFLTVRISRNGLRLILFTRDKTFPSVEPILQKDFGGKLWGRIKIEKETDLSQIHTVLTMSLKEMSEALKAGEATAWWAITNRMKNDAKQKDAA